MTRMMMSKFPGTCHACGCAFPLGTEIIWTRGVGAKHATPHACAEAKVARLEQEKRKAEEQKNKPVQQAFPHALPGNGAHPIVEFLKAAQKRGLKRPKLRVLAPIHLRTDACCEMRLSLTTGGMAPGSLSVVIGNYDGYMGCIRPDGMITGRLAADLTLQSYLMAIAENPANAAKEYASLMGLCSFCGMQLTDAGSVEVGYGPVCAKKWGLPHKPKGTPVVSEAPEMTQ